MRILMATPVVGDAFGQERVVRETTRLLRGVGHEVFLLGQEKGDNVPECEGYEIIPNLTSFQLLSHPLEVKRANARAFEFVRRASPDIVHFIDQYNPLFMAKVVSQFRTVFTAHTVAPTCPSSTRMIAGGGICEKRSGWKCAVYHREQQCLSFLRSDLRRLHAIHHYLWKRRVASRMNRVVAVSRYIKQVLIADGWDEQRIDLVYNPVHLPAVTPHAEKPRRTLIVSACRLVPLKGISFLIDALKTLAGDWEYWVVGDGPARAELEARAAGGLTGKIRFFGKVSIDEAWARMAAADIFVQPNIGAESFGMSVAEASGLGIPVVCSDVPAMNEIILHEKNGLLVTPGDAPSLAVALQRLMWDPALREKLGNTGRQWIRETFSSERHLAGTLDVYALVTGKATGAALPLRSSG